jgi:peptidoglycan/xylan/chitin deacetylase (PgdA/CDA1 family)
VKPPTRFRTNLAVLFVTSTGFLDCGGSRPGYVESAAGRSGTSADSGVGGSVAAGGTTAATGGTIVATGGSPISTGGTGIGTGGSPVARGGSSAVAGATASDIPSAGNTGVARPSGTAGNLRVLNWGGFKGAVTYTFDDANSSQITNYSKLQGLGVHLTFYLQTGKSDASDPIWTQAVSDGHELGNHTQSHPQTGTATEVDTATAFIQSHFGVTVWTMAAPYGDSSYVDLAKTRFLINRGVSNAIIAPNDSSNPFNLPCYVPPAAAAASVMNAQIDSAQSAGGWRVVLVHGFIGGSDGAYQAVDINEFTASVEHAKSLGNMWIDSMVNVGAYWRGQKVFSTANPTTSGSDTTWNWTLPANFPPGKYLRVTVDGGTLVQNGAPLEWDSHGYYQVSLDAGSLTLSP